jgi:hypothetical protein
LVWNNHSIFTLSIDRAQSEVKKQSRENTQKLQNMEKMVLKPEVLDEIKEDGDLFITVSKALGISHFTLPDFIRRNDVRLTQYSSLEAIASRLNKEHKDLVTPQRMIKQAATAA